MKKLVSAIPIILFSFYLNAQTETKAYKSVADSFEQHYNASDYEAIFNLFASEMKEALPLEQTKQTMEGLKAQFGTIISKEFSRYENSYALYKTTFKNTVFGVSISIDSASKINGLYFRPYEDDKLPKLERNSTKLILPFKDEWTVIWGGDTVELNYHVESKAQKNAFDFVITDDKGKSYKTDGKTNEDYYAFGKELIAPCDAEVVLVVDGVKDNKPGVMNPIYVPGNTVILKTANDEYLFFAHFKQHSIVVKQGQKVKQGELLGLCGNSGNSSEAHLHFHIQNTEEMSVATGAKCYFDTIIVNGKTKKDYSPIQKEKIRN